MPSNYPIERTTSALRIAILGCRGIPAEYGGYETFAQEIGVRLARQGLKVTVFCLATQALPPGEYQGVRLEYIQARNVGSLTNLLYDLQSLLSCRSRFDIVYMLGHSASPFCFLPRLFGRQVWINLDGLEWKRSKWNRWARMYLRFTESVAGLTGNLLIADAQAIADHYRRSHPWKTSIAFIPYGVRLPEGNPAIPEEGLERGGYYCLVARLEPENQVLEIIEGFLASSTPRPLVIIGNLLDTPYCRTLQAHAGARVRFLGGVYDQARLMSLRQNAFAAFHGHTVGGTNPSLLEAMAAQRPILAHDNPFNREVGGDALLFFNGTLDILPLIQDLEAHIDSIAALCGEGARVRLEAAYTWEIVTQQYAELVQAACGRLP